MPHVTSSPRLTGVRRDAYEAVRRAVAAPYDSIRLRQELAERLAPALPSDVSAIATSDPEFGVLVHALTWDYPDALLGTYYTEVYPQEGALHFIDLARSGEYASTESGPVEREYLRAGGLGDKLHVAFVEQGRMWGGACLTRVAGAPSFSDEELSLAALVAPLIGAGLRRAALLEAAQQADAGADESAPTAPGVAVYDARGRLLLREGRASCYLADLADIGTPSDLPSSVAAALTRLRWRMRAADAVHDPRAEAGVRVRGESGRWYSVHASATDTTSAQSAGQTVVVLTPLGGGERANVLAQLYGLTPREREIVGRVARGESGKQIAAALGLSSHTVQAHIDNACAKIGARGRREIVARLFIDTVTARMAH